MGLIAGAGAIAFTGVAFIVGVGGIGDISANAVVAAAFFRRGTSLASAGADIAAAEAIDAIVGETLVAGAARHAVVVATIAGAVAATTIAIVVRVSFGEDGSADAVCAGAFFDGGTGHAAGDAGGIATDAVGAVAGGALAAGYATRAIGLWGLRLVAGARAIAFAGIAFSVGIFSGENGSTGAVVPSAFACFGAGVTHLRTDVAATETVDAVVGQTLRFIDARHAIVLFAHAQAITCAAPAFVIGIFVVGNGPAEAVIALVFLGRGAGLAGTQAPTIATDAVGAIVGCALRGRRTWRAIGLFRDRCRTGAGAVTCAAIRAFVVRIGPRSDISANAILAAALLGCAARLASVHANVVAAEPVNAVVGQTLSGCGARKTIVVFALIFPVACAVGAIIVRVGVIRNRPTNAVGTAALFRNAARHALVVAFLVTAKSVDTIARGALSPGCTRRRRRRRSDCHHLVERIADRNFPLFDDDVLIRASAIPPSSTASTRGSCQIPGSFGAAARR